MTILTKTDEDMVDEMFIEHDEDEDTGQTFN